eukprot:TRINITY_DN35059_c0_g1_i1.p1 TRINITY_DN35059_c0_g1~~TRINITY_DN35059_c0_g1_i1.p1  ORF type:complete len:435 (+),score=110.07 TRINITY_DN35059_c0_g1_i1:80-1306(+)
MTPALPQLLMLTLPTAEERQRLDKEIAERLGDKAANAPIQEVYAAACAVLKRRPNSSLLRALPSDSGSRLSELCVVSNYLADPAPLAAVALHCRHLKMIDLRQCGLQDAGMPVFVSALIEHPTVQCADLSGNPQLTDEAVRLLVTLLTRNNNILCLRCEGSAAPRHTMRRLRAHSLENYYRGIAGRSQVAAVRHAFERSAAGTGKATCADVCAFIAATLGGGGRLPAACAAPRQCLPWEAVEAQRPQLLKRTASLPGRLADQATRPFDLDSVLDHFFSYDIQILERRKEYGRVEKLLLEDGGERARAEACERRAGLPEYLALSAATAADCWPPPNVRRKALLRGYLATVADEADNALLAAARADGTVAVADFAAAAGLPVAEVVDALQPLRLTAQCRVGLGELGRAFA